MIEAAGGKGRWLGDREDAFLVAGEDTGKTKLEAATKNGVAVIDEAAGDAVVVIVRARVAQRSPARSMSVRVSPATAIPRLQWQLELTD